MFIKKKGMLGEYLACKVEYLLSRRFYAINFCLLAHSWKDFTTSSKSAQNKWDCGHMQGRE